MTITTIVKVQDGKLVVEMPKEQNNTAFEVTIVPVSDSKEAMGKMAQERLRSIQKFAGIFKNSTYTVNEEDVYNQ
ncbi:MAG TPA: hypothetical protein VLZ75_14665 [Chitinophagales bacterium]|nr:hypothetical protein [Chitinophagales bacterium]